MDAKKSTDIFELVAQFQNDMMAEKRSIEEMYRDVLMMHYKIRPIYGDITMLNMRNTDLIEILWRLGKLDEFYRNKSVHILPKDRKVFSQLIMTIHEDLQMQLRTLHFKYGNTVKAPTSIEMEIFKDRRKSKVVN